MWIDTHCHLDAAEFDADRGAVLARAQAAGVGLLVLPSVAAAHFEPLRELAHQCGQAYALGIHPLYSGQALDTDLDLLDAALQRHRGDPRLVAVGEIGLDHFVPGLDRARQMHFYLAQLKLARRHGLPVILHVRRSADALLQGLRRFDGVTGIAHAFNASDVQAHAFVERGFKLGFGGAMTFERALQIRRLAAQVSPQALVLETDAPDMPPQWRYQRAAERAAHHAGNGAARGATDGATDGAAERATEPAAGHGQDAAARAPQSRNEPAELPRIAQTLAALRGWSLEETAAITRDNALQALPRLAALALPAHPPTESSFPTP